MKHDVNCTKPFLFPVYIKQSELPVQYNGTILFFIFLFFFFTQVARALVRPVYTFVVKVVFIWLSIRICYAALLWQFNRPSYIRFLIPPPNNMRSLHVGDEDPRNNWCPGGATLLNTREDKSLGLFGKKLCNKSLIKIACFPDAKSILMSC